MGIPPPLSGTGRGIIEDVGGVSGLENFAAAFEKRSGEEYRQYRDWLGITSYGAKIRKVNQINEMAGDYRHFLFCQYHDRTDEDSMTYQNRFEDRFGSKCWYEEDRAADFWIDFGYGGFPDGGESACFKWYTGLGQRKISTGFFDREMKKAGDPRMPPRRNDRGTGRLK